MGTKRIAIISYIRHGSPEGLSRRLEGLTSFLTYRGWKVTIYSPSYGGSTEAVMKPESVNEVRVFARTPKSRLERALALAIYAVKLAFVVFPRLRQVDVIQLEHQYLSFLNPVMARLSSAPVVTDDFMFVSTYEKGLTRIFLYVLDCLALRTSTLVVSASVYAVAHLKRLGIRMLYAPNGVIVQENLPRRKQDARFLFVGSLAFKQNVVAVSNLIQAVGLLKDKQLYPQVMVVGGPDSEARRLKAISDAKGLGIRFMGRVTDSQLQNYLSSFSVGLLPFFEDTPNTGGQRIKALEFLSHGLLVLSGPEGLSGIPGIQSGSNCLIVRTLPEFVASMESILQSWEQYEDLAREGSRLAGDKLSWMRTLTPYGDWLDALPSRSNLTTRGTTGSESC